MFQLLKSTLLGLSLASVGSALVVSRAPEGEFSLYGYGDGIGGARLFYSGGTRYSSDFLLS
jgi:hypothetical protein